MIATLHPTKAPLDDEKFPLDQLVIYLPRYARAVYSGLSIFGKYEVNKQLAS